MIQTALVTGATSGIGKATAWLLAEKGYNVIITGRRQERLDELSSNIMQSFGVKAYALCFDVRNYEAVKKSLADLPDEIKSIDALVNNAGLAAGLSDIQDGDVDDWERMIDTNIKGLLYMTKEIVRRMIEQKGGHIVNISSVAGKEAYPRGNVYCATKFAVDALNKSMRIDLLQHGIKVTAINPGLLESEFSLVRFHGDEAKAKQVYMGITPLTGGDVAEAIWFALSQPAHVNIAEITLTPAAQATARDVVRK